MMNAQISQRILNETKNGKELPEAYDAVMGAGSYDKLASDIYEALRKEK